MIFSLIQLLNIILKLRQQVLTTGGALLLVLAIWILPTACLAEEEALVPKLIFFEDFEGGDFLNSDKFRLHGKRPVVSFEGNLNVTLEHSRAGVDFRSELVPSGLPTPFFTGGQETVIGPIYWYAVKIRLNGPYSPDSDSGESLLQWIGMADSPDNSENARNPAAALMIRGKRYAFAARADSKPVTPSYGTPNRYTRNELLDLGPYSNDVGVWTCWIVNLRWNYLQGAILTIWKNGKILIDQKNVVLGYNDRKGPVFKFGLYKWAWNSRSTQVRFRRLEFDDLAIGTGKLNTSMLLPDGCINLEFIKGNVHLDF